MDYGPRKLNCRSRPYPERQFRSFFDKISLISLRARKLQQRSVVMVVRGAQRFDILPAHVAGLLQVCSTPTEPFTAEAHNEQVRHHARMPPVAIRERMNLHQPVMKPH